MSTNTVAGSWFTITGLYTDLEQTIDDYIDNGDPEWRDLVESSGALDAMRAEFRAACDNRLPADCAWIGDQLYVPADPEPGEYDGYAHDEHGHPDWSAMMADIDELVPAIVDAYEPLTAHDIGALMLSNAARPDKVATTAMRRAGVTPFYGYQPHPESGRLRAIYSAQQVHRALAAMPKSRRARAINAAN